MNPIPRIYRSTDPGAPALTGQAGTLLAVLDAVLVNGYGTGPDFKQGAGWTIAVTGTNKRAYRNSYVTGTGGCLLVEDTGLPGNARHAWMRAYSNMSQIDVGDDPSPSSAQMPNGMLFAKSNMLDSVSRAWWVFATDAYAYIFVDVVASGAFAGVPYVATFIGNFPSNKPGDLYNFALIGNNQTAWVGGIVNISGLFTAANDVHVVGTQAGGWVLRGHSLAFGSEPIGMPLPPTRVGIAGSGGMPYPDVVGNGLIYAPMHLKETAAGAIRGVLPRVYHPLHAMPFSDGEIVEDIVGAPPGTRFLAKWASNRWAGPQLGGVLFDITGADFP